MQVEAARLPTLESVAENTVYLVRVGSDEWNSTTLSWADDMEMWIKKSFGSVPLADLNPFDVKDSPLSRIGDWKVGKIRFSFISGQSDDPTRFSLLYPSRRVVLVIGLLHCPSASDLGKTFKEFHDQTFKMFPFLDDTAMRCCAFDISDEQQALFDIPDLMKKGLEVFPPSSAHMIEDTQETAIQFHFRFVLNTATSRLLHRQEALVRECDTMAEAMKKVLVRRSSSGLIASAVPSPSASSSSPSSIPPIKDAETCRLFAGSPSFPGDASHPLGTTITSTASRRSFKVLQARLQVWSGKHCLLAGSPLDALSRLIPAASACRSAEDNVWEAVCCEAIGCARAIVQSDEWTLPDDIASPPPVSTPPLSTTPTSPGHSGQHGDMMEGAISLLQKSLSNPSVRRLLAETCIRTADLRWSASPPQPERAAEVLVIARRAHAEQPSLAWYMSLEGLLWAKHSQPRLMLVCVMEAFLRFAHVGEYERAFRVVEEDFGAHLSGFVPFTSILRRSRSDNGNAVDFSQSYSYPNALVLRRLIKVASKRSEDRNRVTFYGFQFLGMMVNKKRKTQEDRDDILHIVHDMANTREEVVTIDSISAATFPMILSVMPLSVDPEPKFEITGEDLAAEHERKNIKRVQEKSVFLYSPFRPTQKVDPSSTLKEPEEKEVFWIEGEDAYVMVELKNAFDVPVSCTVGMSKDTSVKVVVPGRDIVKVKLGPIKFEPEAEVQSLELASMGAKFVVKFPMPTVVYFMPLLERVQQGQVFFNKGKGRAHLLDPSGKVLLEIDPGKTCKATSLSTVLYCNREQRPRLIRELLPSVPSVTGMRIQRCDTMDHLVHGTTASCLVSLDVADSSRVGKDLKVFSQEENTVLLETSVTSNRMDVRVVVPRDKDESVLSPTKDEAEMYSTVTNKFVFALDGHPGALMQNFKSVSVQSTAPSVWCFATTTLSVSDNEIKMLDSVKVTTNWALPQDTVGLVHFELVVFKHVLEKYERCDEDVAWSGASSWACLASDQMTENVSSFALLRPGEYVLAWSATSKLRVRWWLRCVRVVAL